MEHRTKQIRHLSIAGSLLLAFASVGFAQTWMTLTGAGDGANANNVYVSPYQGTVGTSQYGSDIYTGYIICDDFVTDSYIGTTWQVTATNAGAETIGGLQKFNGSSYVDPFDNTKTFTDQQAYDAVAWLANQLLLPANVTNWTAQTNYSFAIWDIFDGRTDDPDGGAQALISQAFTAATTDGYVGSDVTVYTPSAANPNGKNASQEFLVVSTPEPSMPATLGVELAALVGVIFLTRRRLVGGAPR